MKEEELKPYFSLENVLKELFRLSNDIFGITIKQQTCVETWHEDVRFYDVYENDKLVAGFYLDPYVREETKKSGAWMNSCVDKNKALKHDVPIAYLICNGTPPSKDKPSLMSFSDVETLFHEYGHGLQHMLTKIDNGEISGINSIEWDAVELPSQFMENWCYNKQTLDRMALHYETGEKLPQQMYESLVMQKNYGAGMAMMRQISFSKIDLYLYNNWKSIKESGESIWDIQNKYFQECTPYKTILPEDKFLASFSHIFSGYAAGYYSYKWAEIMSADCFEAFEENMENYKEKGLEFRNSILALGGSKPAMDVFKMFRGREPKVDALLKHNQLA
jgi:oligopeptidase A